jgi:hypothetical protein
MSKLSPLWETVLFSPWLAGALLALIAAVYVTVRRDFLAANPIGALVSATGAFAVALLALYLVQLIHEENVIHERNAARLALETREHDLSTKALALRPLGCLDFTGSDLIEPFCEKALFSDPVEIAAAVLYVSARLALFVDENIYAKRYAEAFQYSRSAVQRAAERDRFGLYAHVLSVQYGCSQVACDFFAFLEDSTRLKANLRERVFAALLNRHAITWVDPRGPQTTGSPAATQSPQRPVTMRGLDLPPAASSIPPVSIMSSEPAVPSAASAPPEGGRQNHPPASGEPRPRQIKPQNILPGNQ